MRELLAFRSSSWAALPRQIFHDAVSHPILGALQVAVLGLFESAIQPQMRYIETRGGVERSWFANEVPPWACGTEGVRGRQPLVALSFATSSPVFRADLSTLAASPGCRAVIGSGPSRLS